MKNEPIHLAEETISADELNRLGDWVKGGHRLTKGPLTLEFERRFAAWQGSKHALFVNSGSSANLLVAWALLEGGYLRNKKVIAPAVSWCTTVTPFIQFGYEPVLCDCDKNTLGFDLKHFEALCKKERPALAILVHVLGHANQMDKLRAICKKHKVLLVEDSCEALGSAYKSKKCGSMGLAGTFSFYYGHHISTIEGGMIVTDDDKLHNLMVSVRSHGWARDVSPEFHDLWSRQNKVDEVRDLYTFYNTGFNVRSTDLNAFLGLSQLKKIDRYTRIRARNFGLYQKHLKGFWGQTSATSVLSSFAYGVLVKNRLETYKHLQANGIENRPLICGNIGLHPFWVKRYGAAHLPMADIVHNHGLYLPNHAQLTPAQVKRVCDTFKEVALPY